MSADAKRKAAFVTHEGLFQFWVMPFGLCNARPRLSALWCGMRWSRCLVYLDDVISFSASISEALIRLEEVLCRLSDFGLQLKAKKCIFMQTEVAFLGHILGRIGTPGSIKQVCQFVGLSATIAISSRTLRIVREPLVALTRKGVAFAWNDRQQVAFDTQKSCLLNAPILGFPTEDGQFILDTDASLVAVGGVLS